MRHVEGDITKAPEEHIVHGCNAQGVMGKGVAKAIREAFPGCFEVYRDVINTTLVGLEQLYGTPPPRSVLLSRDITFYDAPTGKTIHNLISQIEYYRNADRNPHRFRVDKYASYLAIIDGLRRMCDHDPSIKTLAIPEIGCGLGGLKWSVMWELLLEIEEEKGIEFVVYRLETK